MSEQEAAARPATAGPAAPQEPRDLNELVAGVAHDLGNSLAAMVAFSQLIRTDPALPADLRAQADLLIQEAERTRRIVGNLLDVARQDRSVDASAGLDAGRDSPAEDDPRPVRPARILVLDDEPSIREFLRRVVVRHGHEPVLASTGPEALDLIRDDPPDAVLCDQHMAGMSGAAFFAEVAAIEPTLAKRFALMSGDVVDPDLRDFAAAHGIRLLGKPFDIAIVGSTVRDLLGGATAD